MCGIVALLSPGPAPERALLGEQMCALLAHRGPDDAGLYDAGSPPLLLGHRRLSIIDLSQDGHQPMRRGPLVAAYNGEIYNYLELKQELSSLGHSFCTRSDTEVLLAAFAQWGPDALHRLNGMFALLLWDEERRQLHLCRDRFGVKPLYYLFDPHRPLLLCASEPKAILHAARELRVPIGVDRQVLARFLADATTEDDELTFFDRIRRVLPGERIEVDLSGWPAAPRLRRARWYHLRPETCGLPGPPGALAAGGDERFRALLTDAVRLRLRSDVPVGTCLSGGLDSSAIVCLSAQALGVRPHTFSAVYGGGDPADESRFIDAVARHAGVVNHKVLPEEAFSPEALLRFLHLHDEPVGGTSVWAQHCVFRLARQHGVTVMLDGQGADETLTGYHGAFRPLWADLLGQRALGPLLRELRAARRLHGHRSLPGLLGAAWLLLRDRAVPPALYERYLDQKWRGFFSPKRNPFFRLPAPPRPHDPPYVAEWSAVSPLHGYLYQLIAGSSLQTILRYEDRNSMAASIEARAPFLDYRLVQHCLSQPADRLVEDGYTKALLRRTLRGVLPEQVRLRVDKIGFATPEGRWLRGPLRPILADLLASRSLAQRGWFDVPALQRAFTSFCARDDQGGASASSYGLFKALNVEIWLRQHALTG